MNLTVNVVDTMGIDWEAALKKRGMEWEKCEEKGERIILINCTNIPALLPDWVRPY